MTGEATLRGLVLPVGGIKEKVLAAKRAGIKKVLLPEKNRKDVAEISENALEGLTIAYVSRMNTVLDKVLMKKPIEDPEAYFKVPDSEKRAPREPGELVEQSMN